MLGITTHIVKFDEWGKAKTREKKSALRPMQKILALGASADIMQSRAVVRAVPISRKGKARAEFGGFFQLKEEGDAATPAVPASTKTDEAEISFRGKQSFSATDLREKIINKLSKLQTLQPDCEIKIRKALADETANKYLQKTDKVVADLQTAIHIQPGRCCGLFAPTQKFSEEEFEQSRQARYSRY